MFRKVAPWYAKRFGPANEFNKRVVRYSEQGASSTKSWKTIVRWRQQFLDEDGELKPSYQPARWWRRSCRNLRQRRRMPYPCRKDPSKSGDAWV